MYHRSRGGTGLWWYRGYSRLWYHRSVSGSDQIKLCELTGSDLTVSSSGSIAVAVVLSVAILALLAILSYCFLRGRRERSQSSASTGPAHVPLSEQETLVYNSTTKPV